MSGRGRGGGGPGGPGVGIGGIRSPLTPTEAHTAAGMTPLNGAEVMESAYHKWITRQMENR